MSRYGLIGVVVVAISVRLLCLMAVEPTKLMGGEVDHFLGRSNLRLASRSA